MKTIIHVNRNVIAKNAKQGDNAPAITAKNYKRNQYGRRVNIIGPQGQIVASVVQRDKPLKCGARVWIETNCNVVVSQDA